MMVARIGLILGILILPACAAKTGAFRDPGALKDPDGWIGFKNSGAYVAKFFMSWTEEGKPKSWSSGKRAAGYTEQIRLPANAKNIHIHAQAHTGFRWRTIFDLKLQGPPNKVYVASGTTLHRKHSVKDGF